MTSDMIQITPPLKSEAWKFSPKPAYSSSLFKKLTPTSLEDIKEAKVAIGPSAQQFEALSLSDLEDDGYIRIQQVDQSFRSDTNTDRAVMDKTLSSLYSSLKALEVTFLKPLPSSLWISPNSGLRLINFILSEGVQQNICVFESETAKDHADGFLFNFKLESESKLELGLLINTSNSSFSQINIETGKESTVSVFSLISGETDYKRLEVNIFKKDAGSEVFLNGLCFVKGNSSLEFSSNIFHLNKNQRTTQVYKTICSDKGKAIFKGRIHLTENAAGAIVEQLNNNLLLGKRSSVDTQPELNIYQDDVKASHGATTATIDDEHLFYFASRGFKESQSKKMLLKAFCSSSFSNLKNKGFIDYFSDALTKELKHVD